MNFQRNIVLGSKALFFNQHEASRYPIFNQSLCRNENIYPNLRD